MVLLSFLLSFMIHVCSQNSPFLNLLGIQDLHWECFSLNVCRIRIAYDWLHWLSQILSDASSGRCL